VNKAELIESVQKTLGEECSRAHAERCVNAIVQSISKGLKKDRSVQIVGFGTFMVKNRKPRVGRNPQTGQEIQIPASKTVGFKPGSQLKASI
jgi:nucleoid DNA-binding protein